jgi:glutathione peroxidase-family protein
MKKLKNIMPVAAALALLTLASCANKSFTIKGEIADAKDSTLFLENLSLDGPVKVDSVKLSEDGQFEFSAAASDAPEFYRLRIAGQIINIAIDSTEEVTVKASYPTMSAKYDVEGSDDNLTIRELAYKQIALQAAINSIVNAPTLGVDAVKDSVAKVVFAYKADIKSNYIFRAPMKASSYFALFQTYRLGYTEMLVFNPQTSADDVKVFAAVATSWDTNYPKALRGQNLHNIALEGMKNVRIIRAQMSQNIDPSKVVESGIIDINLTDNHGQLRRLSSLKGKVVLLDFHAFSSNGSTQRIMQLRELYNKYHAAGLEIYQVALDGDEHFWKQQVAALPWVNVRDAEGVSASEYNVQQLPTFFLISKDNVLYKRDAQIKDLDQEIKSLL